MRRTAWLAAIALGALLSGLPAQAREVAGVAVAESARVGDAELVLNGAGVRSKFFVRVYVGALYLPVRADTVAAVLAQGGPRRVAMHVLYGEIAAGKLVDGWNDGFAANLTPPQLAALRPRIDRFNALFDTVHQGDVITLDYRPGAGTAVTIRGEHRGLVAGRDFNDALLRVWLGGAPADGDLKQAMLGGD